MTTWAAVAKSAPGCPRFVVMCGVGLPFPYLVFGSVAYCMAQGKKEQPAPLRGRRRWARGSACTRRGTTGSSDEPKTGDGGGEGKGYLVGGDSGCNERCAPRGKHCTLHSTPGAAPPTLWAPAACNLCEIRIYTIGLLGALWPIFWCGTRSSPHVGGGATRREWIPNAPTVRHVVNVTVDRDPHAIRAGVLAELVA